METVHNSGFTCPYCHAFMYGHMNKKNNIEAICPQCGFSFERNNDNNNFCVETVINGELVDDSGKYFETKDELIKYCENSLLNENEEFYVTKLDGDTWIYDKELSDLVNKRYEWRDKMEEIKKEIREWLNFAPLTQECNCSCYEELCGNVKIYYHMKESIKEKLLLYFSEDKENNSNYRVVTEEHRFENLRKDDAIDKALVYRDCSSGDIEISNNLQKIII